MEEKEIIEIIKKSFSINSVCIQIYGYNNKGSVNKIKKIIDKYKINIEHFSKDKNKKRKYEIIKKICPICSIEFETKKASRDEKTTCSKYCSNLYFQHGKNNPTFNKEKYENRYINISKSLIKGDVVKEEIEKLYMELGNIEKVSKKLNISRQSVRDNLDCFYKIEKEKIKSNICLNCSVSILENKKSNFCCTICSITYNNNMRYNKYIEDWKNNLVDGGTCQESGCNCISTHIRKYLFKKYDFKCALCKWGEINLFTNSLPLEVHHIDGDSLNNKESNLFLLCPNCHSLTEKHKNKGRRYHRQKYRIEKGLNKGD